MRDTKIGMLSRRRYSGNRAADAGKLVKLDHLEEVKVVTRFPQVHKESL